MYMDSSVKQDPFFVHKSSKYGTLIKRTLKRTLI